MKGRCLNRLTMEPHRHLRRTPRVGLEPTTTRLTAECSTIELSRITPLKVFMYLQNFTQIIFSFKPFHLLRKMVISTTLRFVSMCLLRKLPLVNPHSSANKFALCSGFLVPIFLRFWSSPRPISGSPLHALLHFHSCPIYLILFQGSYFL